MTVLINKKRQEIKTVFGNGSEIRASLNGEYEVSKPDSTRVFVNRKGTHKYICFSFDFEHYILGVNGFAFMVKRILSF